MGLGLLGGSRGRRLPHVFCLQAPRDLAEQELRHWNASVGHAVSRDLRDWRVLPNALHPGTEEAWDDGAIWTGSVVEHNGTWHMLYTGINKREKQEEAIIQRIGRSKVALLRGGS